MRTIRDAEGNTYLLLQESSDAWKVRDPETGEETYVDGDALEPVDDASPLTASAERVPEPVRLVLTATPDERALGLLVELHARGPLSVRHLLDATELCESDLLGQLAEFRAAGLVTDAQVAGERGYATTDRAAEALSVLRG